MKDKIFIDTNILVYASLDGDKQKQQKALMLLKGFLGKDIYISTQVLNELYNALKKNGLDDTAARKILESYISQINILPVTLSTVKYCLDLRDRYGYSYWDSLILSSAISAGCDIVYSEDMHNRQIIHNQMKLCNPFV